MNEAASIWMELMETDFTLRHVDAGGISTRVLEAGEGPTLVFSNGTSGHLECYARCIKGLASDFRIVCYDSVGHGFTDKPEKPYTLPVYSDHLLALLDALEIDRALLSGESLGGWVSAWFAAEHPERVERLILNTPGNVTMKPEFMKTLSESTRRAVAEATPETVRPRLELLFAPPNRHLVTDELVDVRVAVYGQPGFDRAIENILVLQDPEIRRKYTYEESWCSKIEAPTLIVWTSEDPSGTPEEGKLLQSWIPGSEYTLVERAGHWLQWELPEEFNQIHRDFLLAAAPA
jgi:2-hydroxy-6-oxonona-2,4-dienedioate hydrolase